MSLSMGQPANVALSQTLNIEKNVPQPQPLARVNLDTKMDDTLSKRKRKKVNFSAVQVRDYDRILGEFTEIAGPPLTLGWDYDEREPCPVDEYEAKRSPRRAEWQLKLNSLQRRNILICDFGYSEEELKRPEIVVLAPVQQSVTESKENDRLRKKSSFRQASKGVRRFACVLASSVTLMGSPLTVSSGSRR